MKLPDPPRTAAGKLGIAATCLGLLALVAWFDHITGWQLSFSLFYLVPVALAAVALGRRAGLAVSVIGAVVWWAIDSMSGIVYQNAAIGYWNATVRLGFYVIVAATLGRLTEAMAELRAQAVTDVLTGAPNRRAFYDAVTHEIERSRRYARGLSIGVMDVDGFKVVNDTEGHPSGDRLLKIVADVLRKNLRGSDVSARLGGDEFAVLLPETDGDAARATCDKLRVQLVAAAEAGGWHVTFSFGVATFSNPPDDPDATLRQADELLYEAKRNGKNQVVQRSGRPSLRPPGRPRE